MKIRVPVLIDLSLKETEEIVKEYLRTLIDGRWIRDGKVFEEHYTSHTFDAEIGDANDPQFIQLKAAIEFKKAMGW